MPSPDITAGNVMDKAAVLMNDAAKQEFTYTVQLPFLQMALQDLRKQLQLNNSPVTNHVSTVITIPAGTVSIGFGGVAPKLPDDLIEIQQLWESNTGTNQWIPITKVEFLPHYLEGATTNQFLCWAWLDNNIKLPEASADIDIKLDYIKDLFTVITDENSVLRVINCDSYLQYHTAALLAEFVAEDKERAESLDGEAVNALDIMLGIDNKGRQQIATRRRPFRAAWKSRGWW